MSFSYKVFELLKKLYQQEFGCSPPSPKSLDTAAPEAPSKAIPESAKAKEDKKSEISDNYDDDFDLNDDAEENKPKLPQKTEDKKKEAQKESSDDDWGMDDDWGEPSADSKK